ncbi:hypothetical protein [Allokutzneria oryzae]|uniref:LysR substrate-binding domain-containing protein n=1 Tax=Allokutzneria oryzae TaxID=1378989 RepID=A0ABV5ZXU5_9PSEU
MLGERLSGPLVVERQVEEVLDDLLVLRGSPGAQSPGASLAERAYWAGQDHALPVVSESRLSAHGPVAYDSAQLLETVALGQAVARIPTSLARLNQRDDIVYRPVLDAGPYTTVVARPAGSRSPWIARFVRVAVELTTGDSVAAAG